ncbi:MAG TPA: DUF5602 domain-containing protein [Magnetospirillum sp.]|jgi:hypothetical protein|nr:DUF5602 domain-containing protein [Magnetospirillum sp.]
MRASSLFALALLSAAAVPAAAADLDKSPPPAPYQAVSKLVALPDFLPGMGTLYVDPKTLPAGPFLAYDRSGKLVSTIYMIPIEDINAHKKFDDLKTSGHKVDHVDLVFNPGHPGVEKPHYHVVLWHVPASEAAALK